MDLAGSEKASQHLGARRSEGIAINKSLSCFTNVIRQLTESRRNFISFRDSKLTHLLQESLGGNSMTSIICTVDSTAQQ